jgi:arylsulfatase
MKPKGSDPIAMNSEIVKKNSPVIHLLVATASMLPLPLIAQQIDRTVLPVPEPQSPTITELDARNAKAPPRFQVKAPKGAPNVVVIPRQCI